MQCSSPSTKNTPSIIYAFEDESDDEETFKKSKSKGKSNKKVQERWRKSDDTVLLSELRNLLRDNALSLDSFYKLSIEEYDNALYTQLIKRSGWKGTPLTLVQRIKKIYKLPQSLSCREKKKLRKMYYAQLKDNALNWDTLLCNFPGKDREFLIKTCTEFPRSGSIQSSTSTSQGF